METMALVSGAVRDLASSVGLDENLLDDMVGVLDPRFFFVVNGTSANAMTYFLGGLSILALFALLLIVIFFGIGFLNDDSGLFRRHDTVDTYSTYEGQAVDALGQSNLSTSGPFQSRRLYSGYDAINVLYMLEEAFQKLEMSDLSCQQRAVCEAHLPNAQQTLGAVAAKLQDIMGSVDPQTVERSDSEAAKVYNMFRSAAVRGAQQQDCHVHFGSRCSRALGDHVRAKRKL